MTFKSKVSVVGVLLGTLFFAFSLTPSLLPRSNLIQGVISGLAFTSGYGLGILGRQIWTFFGLPAFTDRTQKILTYIAGGISLITVIIFLWQATSWQNSLRTLMQINDTATTRPLVIGLISSAVFIVLLLFSRAFLWIFRKVSKLLHNYVPKRISYAFSLLIAAIIFIMAADGILFSLILRGADASYKEFDRQIQSEFKQPVDPMKTGSKASLLKWNEMGRNGREFLVNIPDTNIIKRFTDQPVKEPIRVYAGMLAGSVDERAKLALQELRRVNAFQRSVLILDTPTGTGWVNPAAIRPVEFLFRGDIATVSAQYSYLPSALSLILEAEYGKEMAEALFKEVYGYWSRLPKDERPDLYLQGLSLGALNSDRSFDLFDIIDDPFNGVLWSGPPFRSETWRHITEERNPGSPSWLPAFRDGTVVRFANQNGGLQSEGKPWGSFRIAYLQYASDPIVFFEGQVFWKEPEWMKPPRGFDVTDKLKWYPVVTMMQLVADMLVGAEAPVGFGHEYASVHYLRSWKALTEPPGWNSLEYEQLESFFSERDAKTNLSKTFW